MSRRQNRSVCTGRAISCCNYLRVLENFCGNLCLSNRVLSPQGVVQIQSDLILCDLLWRQNSVSETETFTKKFSRTHKVTCSCDLSPQRVAATCRLVCYALKTFAAFHSGEHTVKWGWGLSRQFHTNQWILSPPKPHTFVHRNEGWVC